MATVSPGYTFTGTTDPITYTKLNQVAAPTVTIGAGEVVGTMLTPNIVMSGLSLNTNYAFIGAATAVSFGGAISMATANVGGNTRTIACTSNTASTITPTTGGTAGQHLWIIFTTDATGGNVITYASPFKTTGTHTLTGASKYFTIHFVSNGTYWCEVARTAALS